MNKKGFELSIGLIVILILSILIFSLSLYFIFKWFGQAEQLKAEIDRQTEEQIIAALKTGNQLVAIPIAIQQTKRGDAATFGVGVRNIAEQKQFSMATGFSGAYTLDGKQITVDDLFVTEKWLGGFAVTNTFALKKNEQKVIPMLIKADLNVEPKKATPKGDYVFNVCVYDEPLRPDNTPPAECSAAQFRTNSEVYYTGKIYQVTVRVI